MTRIKSTRGPKRFVTKAVPYMHHNSNHKASQTETVDLTSESEGEEETRKFTRIREQQQKEGIQPTHITATAELVFPIDNDPPGDMERSRKAFIDKTELALPMSEYACQESLKKFALLDDKHQKFRDYVIQHMSDNMQHERLERRKGKLYRTMLYPDVTKEYLEQMDLSPTAVNESFAFVELKNTLEKPSETLAYSEFRMTPATDRILRTMSELDSKHRETIFRKLVRVIQNQCEVPSEIVHKSVQEWIADMNK